MTSFNTSAEARLCPHCQQDNRCAIARGQQATECWCQDTAFNAEPVARYQGLDRCLCERCGTKPISAVQYVSETSLHKDSHGQ